MKDFPGTKYRTMKVIFEKVDDIISRKKRNYVSNIMNFLNYLANRNVIHSFALKSRNVFPRNMQSFTQVHVLITLNNKTTKSHTFNILT